MKNKTLDLFIAGITENLDLIKDNPNKVQALVSYYQLLEFIENADHLGKAYLEKLQRKNYFGLNKKKIQILESFFKNNSLSPYGVNRSQPGQMVNSSNIYLGNIYGIWTFPASDWLSSQSKYEKTDSGLSPKPGSNLEYISIWHVINKQAEKILESLIKGFSSKKELLLAA